MKKTKDSELDGPRLDKEGLAVAQAFIIDLAAGFGLGDPKQQERIEWLGITAAMDFVVRSELSDECIDTLVRDKMAMEVGLALNRYIRILNDTIVVLEKLCGNIAGAESALHRVSSTLEHL